MYLPVPRQFFRSWILVLAASCVTVGVVRASAQLQVESDPVTSLFKPSIADIRDFATSTEYPDDPDDQFKRPAPAPVDANRLLDPEVGDQDDGNNTSSSRVLIDNVNVFALYNTIRNRFPGEKGSEEPGDQVRHQSVEDSGHYHWGGLIAQSFFFNGTESAFRIASDDQIRHLLAKKPFWHDYFASLKQFNMRRWNDGDDFLVNYVGHPMQGSISAFIEIQNSPTDRELRISKTREYWMSRFKGFLWATAYSTHSEISPLGEAGIGNEGGWTYPIADCHRPCTIWKPPMHYTNNTGWVDFIITPTVGMLWVLAEDTIDRYVSDRIQGYDQHSVFPKIIRGSLNPSRTFANAMRLKKPWYRDFQHDEVAESELPHIHFLRSDESPMEQKLGRFSVAGHYGFMPLGTYVKSCCFSGHNGGFEADYAVTPWLSASFALDAQQGLSDRNAKEDGSALFTGFGIRLVHDRPHNTVSLAIRPGFVLDDAVIPAHLDIHTGSYTGEKSYSMQHTAATLLLGNDYKINRHFAIRSAIGATVVRYQTAVKDPPGIGKPPYLSWLSHDNYTNHTTWVWQGGPVVRF